MVSWKAIAHDRVNGIPRWDSSPEGNSLGGYGLYLRTEDMAKFGQLMLRHGEWNGQQLVPRKWVEEATSLEISTVDESHARIGPDRHQGYGFQFWRCHHNAFRRMEQAVMFIVMMPDQDAVVAITAATGNMQGELDAVWTTCCRLSKPSRCLPTRPVKKS